MRNLLVVFLSGAGLFVFCFFGFPSGKGSMSRLSENHDAKKMVDHSCGSSELKDLHKIEPENWRSIWRGDFLRNQGSSEFRTWIADFKKSEGEWVDRDDGDRRFKLKGRLLIFGDDEKWGVLRDQVYLLSPTLDFFSEYSIFSLECGSLEKDVFILNRHPIRREEHFFPDEVWYFNRVTFN